MKTFYKWTANIVLSLLIITFVLSLISIIMSKRNPEKPPSVFGIRVMTVLTGSMRPVLEPGDMIITREGGLDNLKQGTIITFQNNQGMIVTHRVHEVVAVNESKAFKTKGDANNTIDQEMISSDQIIGLMLHRIPYGGYIARAIRTPLGISFIFIFFVGSIIIAEVLKKRKTMKKLIEKKIEDVT